MHNRPNGLLLDILLEFAVKQRYVCRNTLFKRGNTMLKEMSNPRQNTDENRRVFTDEFFDLYVWYSDSNLIAGFQLCYDKGNFERAITWTEQSGYSHMKIDDGEGPDTAYKMKPMLVIDGLFDNSSIADRFHHDGSKIEKDIFDFVYEKLTHYQ
jgi:hypothetical protein